MGLVHWIVYQSCEFTRVKVSNKDQLFSKCVKQTHLFNPQRVIIKLNVQEELLFPTQNLISFNYGVWMWYYNQPILLNWMFHATCIFSIVPKYVYESFLPYKKTSFFFWWVFFLVEWIRNLAKSAELHWLKGDKQKIW